MKRLWRKLGILVTGYDAEAQRRELDGLRAALDALPRPVESCPTRIMDGRNELRCWFPAGHKGECK